MISLCVPPLCQCSALTLILRASGLLMVSFPVSFRFLYYKRNRKLRAYSLCREVKSVQGESKKKYLKEGNSHFLFDYFVTNMINTM